MTEKLPARSANRLAHAAGPCYTPAAMAAATPAPAHPFLLHVQAEPLRAANHVEAIALLAATLAQKAGLADARALVHSALQREESEPTYLGKGMALPHARVAGLPCAGVCVAHAAAGIPWNAERAQLVIFLAVPEERPELYLQLMSRLVRWRLRLPADALESPTPPTTVWEDELRALLA